MQSIGSLRLKQYFGIQVPDPMHKSFIDFESKIIVQKDKSIVWNFIQAEQIQIYDLSFEEIEFHFKYAISYESFDLLILVEALRIYEIEKVKSLIELNSFSEWTRKLWFIYEYFVGIRIELDDFNDSKDFILLF